MSDPILQLSDIAMDYGSVRAVRGVSLEIASGSFTALVGESGSGKSTLLKTINALVTPTGGTARLDGDDVMKLAGPALRRRIGYVFQAIGLFPHMSVGENVGIGLKLAGVRDRAGRIAEMLELVELEPALAARMPSELSGGQRQRVGVARALAPEPELLLMDEPFGALDPVTRDSLGDKVRELHVRLGLTTIMVTHDMAEALLLADRVLVMEQGRIVADATPSGLLSGQGGDSAQALVAVPRAQAEKLARMEQ